jgi:hypothetical protein
MTNFKFTGILAVAAAALAAGAATGSASAHGGGMGGSHMGSMTSHTTSSTVTLNTNKSVAVNDHNGRRRFHLIQIGGVINPAPACVYKWTPLGRRVLVCPDQEY